jgi:D-3-phosphoglycerate dehydrogenase
MKSTYGHIGSQLSVLAEAFGMRVIFYDVINLMPLGSARQVESLSALLAQSDFVTLQLVRQGTISGNASKRRLGGTKSMRKRESEFMLHDSNYGL